MHSHTAKFIKANEESQSKAIRDITDYPFQFIFRYKINSIEISESISATKELKRKIQDITSSDYALQF